MGRVRIGTPKMKYSAEKLIKLEYYRVKYGLSQKDMAELLGINTSTYNQKINGRQKFKIDEMIIIHTFLNHKANKNGDPVITLDEIFLPTKLQNCNRKTH